MAHVATFNASSEYAGQQVMYYRGQSYRMGTPFEIIGSGEVDVSFILDRDSVGQLDWVGEEERTWVYSFGHQPITTPTKLIDDATHSTLDREASIRLWEETYADPDALEQARERCRPCVEAILDAAGRDPE